VIYIAYPDIPYRAIVRSTSQVFSTVYKAGNLISGERYLRGKLGSAWTPGSYAHEDGDAFGFLAYTYPVAIGTAGTAYVGYDLGIDNTIPITASANYLLIARADLLLAQNIMSVTLKANTVDTYATAVTITNQGVDDVTLYGPNANDLLVTFTASSAYRYWWLDFHCTAGTTTLEHSKHYFGTYFDFGVAPASWSYERVFEDGSKEGTISGASDIARVEELKYKFDIEWQGVSDAMAQSFMDTIVKRSDVQRFFLFTTAQPQILANKTVMHVKLVNAETTNPTKAINWNTITASFEEIIG
jgi:hypothetical protein